MIVTTPEIYLVDNGSLRAEATLHLRELAQKLGAQTGLPVQPVSLLHSHKVPASELADTPARIVKPSLRAAVEGGRRRFVFVPLFLGPSRAITEYLPGLIDEIRAEAPDLEAAVAAPLAGDVVDCPDIRLAEMLAENVRSTIAASGFVRPKVALVDHGTPEAAVNLLRDAVARQLAERLSDVAPLVVASSMERRAGPSYAFNEPLLENLDRVDGFSGGDLVAALFFLLPGRHAGAGGDVAAICRDLEQKRVFQRIRTTPVLSEHPLLLEILNDRLREALDGVRRSDGAGG